MKTDTCWVTDVAPGIWPFLWALHSQTLEWICWDIHVWEDWIVKTFFLCDFMFRVVETVNTAGVL